MSKEADKSRIIRRRARIEEEAKKAQEDERDRRAYEHSRQCSAHHPDTPIDISKIPFSRLIPSLEH